MEREPSSVALTIQGQRLKGDYNPNAIHFFAVNLIWKFQ